jgi:hypothetical protein
MSCQLLVASCQWEKQKLPHLELTTFSWPSHCRSNCDCRRRNQLHGRQFQRAGRDVATLKICCSETPTCKDWKQQAANLKIQYHPIVNGPMISPKRCPTTPARATCEIESKCMGKMPMLLESESQALLQTEKPVVFKTTFAEPLAWERRGPVMGRRRGCSLAILQINLEPYHSLVKELLIAFLQATKFRRTRVSQPNLRSAADSFEFARNILDYHFRFKSPADGRQPLRQGPV